MNTKSELRLEEIRLGEILTNLLCQACVTDIMIWGGEVWLTDSTRGHFRHLLDAYSDAQRLELAEVVRRLPRQLAIRMGRFYNESSPFLDGEALYHDLGQLRFNVIHQSLVNSEDAAIAIRKTLWTLRISDESLVQTGFADQRFIVLMQALIDAGCNVMISGETGSGKTELLKYIAQWIRDNEAIITMEDTLEVYLKRLYPNKNVLALKANGRFGFSDLLRSCLRQNPDWICVSETRGKEIIELNEAVGTGHRLISTIHTDSARNIPYRMVEMAQVYSSSADRIFRQIHHNINVGIHIHYLNNEKGSLRMISEVCEYFLDHENRPQCRIIYDYDFKTESYRCYDILSPTILMKMFRKKTDIRPLKGVFIR